jgi:hypothetical protein
MTTLRFFLATLADVASGLPADVRRWWRRRQARRAKVRDAQRAVRAFVARQKGGR